MRYKAMNFCHGFQSKCHNNNFSSLNTGDGNDFHGNRMHLVTIRLPKNWVLNLMTRALLLSLVILSLPWLNEIIGNLSNTNGANTSDADQLALNPFHIEKLFRDLANNGLLKMGDKALFLSNGYENSLFNMRVVIDYNIDVIPCSDSELQSLIPNETYDFMFVHDYHAVSQLINRSLKKNGVVAVQLGDNPIVAFQKPSNYQIVYLHKFDSTIIAMRKISHADANSAGRRRLLGLDTEAKKAALSNLENVLLEPPGASGETKKYLKRTRYLPDLIGDSLESYSRRVFIDVGLPGKDDASNVANWFSKHYPTRNTKFEIYHIETHEPNEDHHEEPSAGKKVAQNQIGMSDWLRKNVKENEYVVMKAEAGVVEEMVRSKAIVLVDELFLECKHRGTKKNVERSRRAYWECLSLYGILRDQGIAVHQWWGS